MAEWSPGDVRWRPEWVSTPGYVDNIPMYLRILRQSKDIRSVGEARVSLEHAVALNMGFMKGRIISSPS